MPPVVASRLQAQGGGARAQGLLGKKQKQMKDERRMIAYKTPPSLAGKAAGGFGWPVHNDR